MARWVGDSKIEKMSGLYQVKADTNLQNNCIKFEKHSKMYLFLPLALTAVASASEF